MAGPCPSVILLSQAASVVPEFSPGHLIMAGAGGLIRLFYKSLQGFAPSLCSVQMLRICRTWFQSSKQRCSVPALCRNLIQGTKMWLGREDSNLRMPGSKPGALPLGDAPIKIAIKRSLVPVVGELGRRLCPWQQNPLILYLQVAAVEPAVPALRYRSGQRCRRRYLSIELVRIG